MVDAFGLVSRRRNLLENELYLGRPDLKDSFLWRRSDNAHVLCIRPMRPGIIPAVATFTLVGIAESSEWYNKLSGLGDYNDNYPKPIEKLKWLLHFKSPVGTPFQDDWDVGISALQYAQRKRTAGDPSDLLRVDASGVQSIRTTSNMFKLKVCAILCVYWYYAHVFVSSLVHRIRSHLRISYLPVTYTPSMPLLLGTNSILSISEVQVDALSPWALKQRNSLVAPCACSHSRQVHCYSPQFIFLTFDRPRSSTFLYLSLIGNRSMLHLNRSV